MGLEEQLAERLRGVVVVMGIGNFLRGDDAAGSFIAQQIASAPGVFVIDAEECPENYVTAIANCRPDAIVLLDSVDMRSEPGSAALLDREQLVDYWSSTHRAPISLLMSVLELATRARVFAIGIQPAHLDYLKPMTSEVEASVAHVAEILNRAIAARGALTQSAAGSSEGEVSA